MVAMCLVKDQTKRPTAEKLLKHSFFKNAKPPELTVKSILTDLPPLWDRVKALQVCFYVFFSYLSFSQCLWLCFLVNDSVFPVKGCCTVSFEENAFFRTRSTFYGSWKCTLPIFLYSNFIFFSLKQARCILHIGESYVSFYLDHVNIKDVASKQIS